MSAVSPYSGVLLAGVVLARMVSPVSLGDFAVVVVALIVVRGLAGFGIERVIGSWRDDPIEIVPAAMAISCVAGCVVGAGAYLAAPAFVTAMGTPKVLDAVRVLALTALMYSATVTPRSIMQRRAPGLRTVIGRTGNWLFAGVTIPLAAAGFGPMSLAMGAIAECLFTGGLLIIIAPDSARLSINPRQAGRVLRSALFPAASRTLTCAIAVADLVVVGHLMHARVLGLYTLALCCASWPASVLSQRIRDMVTVSLARFRHSPRIASSIFTSSVRLAAYMTIPAGIAIAACAAPLVHVLYSPAWQAAARPLPWLVPLAVLRVGYAIANEYTESRISRRISLAVRLSWLVLLIPALVLAQRRDGLVGVAICELVVAALAVSVCFLLALRHADVKTVSRLALLRVVLAAAACVIAFLGLRAIHHDHYAIETGVVITLVATSLLMYGSRAVAGSVRQLAFPAPVYREGGGVASKAADGAVADGRSPGTAGDSLSSKIRVGARWSMLNAVLMRLSSSIATAYLARTVFDPQIWGLYAVSQVVLVVLLSSNELGVCSALVRWDGDVTKVARTVLTISVATSTVIYAALYVLAPYIARTLGSPGATGVVRVLCICVIIDGFAGVPSALITREFAQRRQLVCDTFNFLVSMGVMLGLALTGHGAMSFAWGSVAGSTVATVLYNVFAPSLILPGWNAADARRLLRFGLPLAGAALLMLGVFNVDSAIVGSTLGPVMLGLYALAFNVASWPVTVILQAAGRISFAGFSRVAGSRKRLIDGFSRALAVAMGLTIPASVLLGTLAAPLIHAVYGPRWAQAAGVLHLLAVLGLLRVAYALIYDCLAAAGQRHLLMWIQALWLGSLIPALIFGAKMYGIVGVGAGHVLVAACIVGPAFLWALSRIGITPRHIARACLRPVLGGVAMAATTLLVIHVTGGSLLGLAAATAAGLAVYLPAVYPMRTLLRSRRAEETGISLGKARVA